MSKAGVIARVERLLREAIEKRLEEGYVLVANRFGVEVVGGTWQVDGEWCRACALGLFLLGKPRVERRASFCHPTAQAAAYLGIGEEEALFIGRGFDLAPAPHMDPRYASRLPAFHALGERLRADYYDCDNGPAPPDLPEAAT